MRLCLPGKHLEVLTCLGHFGVVHQRNCLIYDVLLLMGHWKLWRRFKKSEMSLLSKDFSKQSALPPLADPHMASNSLIAKKTLDSPRLDITIHVCDEAKGVTEDFTCPRDLLLKEMQYFQDYLSNDTHKWEEVDISVHCDVKIFDWLIRFVKRKRDSSIREPCLDASNVVSILISSNFLKMEELVDQCVRFFYEHISEILALPCNMNCINDELISRIAALFNQHELEDVKDKKDKLKSKLFTRKIQELFDPAFCSLYSPQNASQLFRCVHCKKLLLPAFQDGLACVTSRNTILRRGALKYNHARDATWDVNAYVLDLKAHLKSWRLVFWRIWGTVNYLYCGVCQSVFPCTEFNFCFHHPSDLSSHTLGGYNSLASNQSSRVYPCCKQPVIQFSPSRRPSGCTPCSHKIDFAPSSENVTHGLLRNYSAVYEEFLRVKEVICSQDVPGRLLSGVSFDGVIEHEKTVTSKNVNPSFKYPEAKKNGIREDPDSRGKRFAAKIQAPKLRLEFEDEEDEEPEETPVVRVVISKPATHRVTHASKGTRRTWDANLPVRLNQDIQREDDLKRMNKLIEFLGKNRKLPAEASCSCSVCDDSLLMPGGIYVRLESKLRTATCAINSQPMESCSNSHMTFKSKGKPTNSH